MTVDDPFVFAVSQISRQHRLWDGYPSPEDSYWNRFALARLEALATGVGEVMERHPDSQSSARRSLRWMP